MFHDIIKAYADALTVATTLRPPAPAREAERFAACEENRRALLSPRLVGRLVRWFRGGSDAAVPAARPRALIPTPQS
jgi:hypothetical protein